MTDIPEDVMKLAREVWSACMKADMGWSRSNPAEVIARAILADRAAQAERMARLEEALRPFAECYARYVKRAEEAKAWGNPAPGFASADRTFSIGALYEAARALSQEGS